MLQKFNDFLASEEATVLYITGQAGTGKTTALRQLVDECMHRGMNTIVCAFTHKACGILNEKLSEGVDIATLHAMLRKRPTINDTATKAQYIEVSRQHSQPEFYDIIFIDEFSMVSEEDYMDIIAACEDPETGETRTKVVYIGDLNQLPPVGGQQAVNPHNPWWIQLTHIYRQAEDNELIDTLTKLVDYINGTEPKPLESNKNFIRGVDLVSKFKESKDAVLLAWTNERVESLNSTIQGYEFPLVNDKAFSPTNRTHFTIVENKVSLHDLNAISLAYGDKALEWGSKYKTLEHLSTMPNIHFMQLRDLDDIETTYAVVFGHYKYKLYLEQLKQEAAAANYACEKEQKLDKSEVRTWAQRNYTHPLAKRRSKAWRDYLTFKECVICLDFPHAMTVHKSQGSTYETVLVDTNDLYKCAPRNFKLYLQLMYVAISRASDKVYTN